MIRGLPSAARWGSFDPRPRTVTFCPGDGRDGRGEPVVRPSPEASTRECSTMNVKNTALRLAGAAMVAVALAPWVGGAAANAAVTVYLDQKWTGTDSATSTVLQAGCAYAELQQAHAGQGWHFVLPGGDGLTSFTANFQSAGQVTVTTTETAAGVIVQGGKGAVVYTPTDDVLVALAAFADHAGQGSAATAGTNDMQLSHLCNGEATPTESPTPTISQSSTPVTSTAVVTTPAVVTTSV